VSPYPPLFEFNNEQIVLRAILPSVVNDNIRENTVGRAATVTSPYAFYGLLHLTVAVVFTVDIPSRKRRFHVYSQAVNRGTFVDDVKVDPKGLRRGCGQSRVRLSA
jgi:hypothetical protein